MSNKAAQILNEIQFKTGKSLEEIAEEIGYSRPYLNNVKLKGGGEKIIGILKTKYAKILQNVTSEVNEPEQGYRKDIIKEEPMDQRTINALAEATRIQAEANKMQAEANLKAESNREELIKLINTTAYSSQEIQTNLEAKISDLEDIQKVVLSHLKVMMRLDAERESGGDRKKLDQKLLEISKRIGEGVGLIPEKGKGVHS